MSKLFYDKLFSFNKIEKKLNKLVRDTQEKQEYWIVIDEIVHHKVLHCILDELDEKHHEEFLVRLESGPHDEGLLEFLSDKIKKDASEFLKKEIQSISREILADLKTHNGRKVKSKKKARSKKQ
ncbi:hypothetical protein IPM62_05810 [Candidatus Woesebacteria bacterium]|nr:MAG: hypothetical protein IPM62_05810 [Candidatus Woesebacteria bacterium]